LRPPWCTFHPQCNFLFEWNTRKFLMKCKEVLVFLISDITVKIVSKHCTNHCNLRITVVNNLVYDVATVTCELVYNLVYVLISGPNSDVCRGPVISCRGVASTRACGTAF
jgi:hypothetical protein